MRSVRYVAFSLLLACSIALSAAGALASGPAHLDVGGSVTCSDDAARARYKAYVAFLERHPDKFAAELATVRQLEASEVHYVVAVGGPTDPRVEGCITTDGERVFVNIVDQGTMPGEAFSLNSIFAHELEHARQFDDGELAFLWDPTSRSWRPEYASYDIGDELKAWKRQAEVAGSWDFWRVREGVKRPSVLWKFANARSDDERTTILRQSGYGRVNQSAGRDAVAPVPAGGAVSGGAGASAGPAQAKTYFGRPRRTGSDAEVAAAPTSVAAPPAVAP